MHDGYLYKIYGLMHSIYIVQVGKLACITGMRLEHSAASFFFIQTCLLTVRDNFFR